MEGEWRREEVEGAGHVQLGEVGIAESARGDSVIVGGLARRTGSLEEREKKGQSDMRETCPSWVTASSAPAQSKRKSTAWQLRLARQRYLCCTPGCRLLSLSFMSGMLLQSWTFLDSRLNPSRTKMQCFSQ